MFELAGRKRVLAELAPQFGRYASQSARIFPKKLLHPSTSAK
jgi:hypothetical protein